MDGSGGYHPEWGNPITKELTWYVLTDKWILVQKLRIPKIQFAKHMKFKNNEDQNVDTSPFLRMGTKYPWKELQRQSLELRLKEGPSRDCPTRGSIPKTTTTPRDYCRCQQEFAGRTLIQLSSVRICQCLANTEVDVHSHQLDGAQSPQWRS